MKIILFFFFLGTITFINAQKPSSQWELIGNGITYKKIASKQVDKIVICFAGWSVKQNGAQNWAEELYLDRLNKNNYVGLFAVQGPKDVFFESLEIETNQLVNYLLTSKDFKQQDKSKLEILVIAHSSGSYVAHHFFHELQKQSPKLLRSITYFNLDGDIGSSTSQTTLTKKIVSNLKKITAVYSFEEINKIISPNKDAMVKIAESFPKKVILKEWKTQNSGCVNKWCIHDALINKIPHNPNGFDLERDYNQMNSKHPVNSEYLD
jgi:hypothetical protein